MKTQLNAVALPQSIDTKLDILLARLSGLRATGNGKHLALCTAHDDRNPSLTAKVGNNGGIILHCFAGCSVDAILAAIGLTMADLFPDPPETKYHGYDRYTARKSIPRFSRYEMFPKLVFESTILAVAIGDLLNGHSLDDAALVRVQQAIETITSVRMEVGV
ncbi:hypothetical protein [Methyloglobulus sp.]|uniref:hypothetical protein n=1 Tax=Methyloglobulus sp. TaxID=2518622 RepID=UPI00398A4C3F